jgi:hypothetical protein
LKKIEPYLCLLAACILFSSCYTPRYVYSPAAHNVPVLVKKGDSKLAVNYSVNFADNTVKENVAVKGKARGFDLQGAYAFSNHWAAQLNYMHRTEKNAGDFDNNLLDSTVIDYRRRLTEMGIGYFHKLDENGHVLFQLFAGAGLGKFGFTDDGRDHTGVYRSRYHQMHITKLFIQPAVMVRSKDNFAASLSSRHSVIYFRNIHTDYTAAELDNYTLSNLNDRPRVFWEPALINNFGFKKLPGIRMEVQLGFSFLMSGRFVDYRSSNVSAGLLADLPKLFANNRGSSNTKLKD